MNKSNFGAGASVACLLSRLKNNRSNISGSKRRGVGVVVGGRVGTDCGLRRRDGKNIESDFSKMFGVVVVVGAGVVVVVGINVIPAISLEKSSNCFCHGSMYGLKRRSRRGGASVVVVAGCCIL